MLGKHRNLRNKGHKSASTFSKCYFVISLLICFSSRFVAVCYRSDSLIFLGKYVIKKCRHHAPDICTLFATLLIKISYRLKCTSRTKISMADNSILSWSIWDKWPGSHVYVKCAWKYLFFLFLMILSAKHLSGSFSLSHFITVARDVLE